MCRGPGAPSGGGGGERVPSAGGIAGHEPSRGPRSSLDEVSVVRTSPLSPPLIPFHFGSDVLLLVLLHCVLFAWRASGRLESLSGSDSPLPLLPAAAGSSSSSARAAPRSRPRPHVGKPTLRASGLGPAASESYVKQRPVGARTLRGSHPEQGPGSGWQRTTEGGGTRDQHSSADTARHSPVDVTPLRERAPVVDLHPLPSSRSPHTHTRSEKGAADGRSDPEGARGRRPGPTRPRARAQHTPRPQGSRTDTQNLTFPFTDCRGREGEEGEGQDRPRLILLPQRPAPPVGGAAGVGPRPSQTPDRRGAGRRRKDGPDQGELWFAVMTPPH